MNRRTFAALAIVTVLLAALAFLAQNGSDSESIAGASAGQLLLPDLAAVAEDLREIEVTGAGRQRLVSLERAEAGWIVAEQDGYPASSSDINALLIALSEARIVEEKTANPDFYARLGVESLDASDASGIEVALVPSDGQRIEVILGDPYGTGQRYARLANASQSVLIDQDPEVARAAADWVVSDIIDLSATRVQRVEVTHADGERLVIRKGSPGDSNFAVDAVPEDRELQYAGVANVTGSVLQGLALEAVTRAPESPSGTLVSAEFWTFDGLVVTVTATADADEEPWLTFRARSDAGQAASFTPATTDDADEDATPAAPDSAAIDREAQELNARLGGWRFRIPSYKYSQMSRRIEDLLQVPATADE